MHVNVFETNAFLVQKLRRLWNKISSLCRWHRKSDQNVANSADLVCGRRRFGQKTNSRSVLETPKEMWNIANLTHAIGTNVFENVRGVNARAWRTQTDFEVFGWVRTRWFFGFGLVLAQNSGPHRFYKKMDQIGL